MLSIIHRVNTVSELTQIPHEYGVEIDVRGYGDRILLSHDPIVDAKIHVYDNVENYLKAYNHRFIVFNMKEAGYEDRVIDLAKKYGIEEYFLLDVEFPYFYKATRTDGFRKLAIRYSEAEPIESVERQKYIGKPLAQWVWIDTNTTLPLYPDVVNKLKLFKTCLVSPDRWGRPEDIGTYIDQMKSLKFIPDAVMTGEQYVDIWNSW